MKLVEKRRKKGKEKRMFEKVVGVIFGDWKYVNERYMEIYLEEVIQDIRLLRDFMSMPRFEREQDHFFSYLVRKYEGDYCPSTYYKFFNIDNQLEYVNLRVEIDALLSRNDQLFSDEL